MQMLPSCSQAVSLPPFYAHFKQFITTGFLLHWGHQVSHRCHWVSNPWRKLVCQWLQVLWRNATSTYSNGSLLTSLRTVDNWYKILIRHTLMHTAEHDVACHAKTVFICYNKLCCGSYLGQTPLIFQVPWEFSYYFLVCIRDARHRKLEVWTASAVMRCINRADHAAQQWDRHRCQVNDDERSFNSLLVLLFLFQLICVVLHVHLSRWHAWKDQEGQRFCHQRMGRQ